MEMIGAALHRQQDRAAIDVAEFGVGVGGDHTHLLQ